MRCHNIASQLDTESDIGDYILLITPQGFRFLIRIVNRENI